MASINYAFKEIWCKIVFYGPGLSGKTTNLQYVYQKIPSQSRGSLISLATDQDRTLYFDFLPVDIGKIHGFSTKFQLYTVPGQVYYNATRKLVLRGVDGLVFVADSQKCKMDENIESFQNLVENLSEYGYNIDKIPLVFQYNKRDLTDISSVQELEEALNPKGLPHFETVAIKGAGVFDTLKCISKLVLDQARRKQLFPEREIKVEEVKKVQAKLNLSHMPQPKQVEAAAGSSTAVESSTPQAVTTTSQKKPEPLSEKMTLGLQETQQKTRSEIELDVGEITEEEKTKMEQTPSRESPTIISWSAGKSGKKVKSKGFFLLRFLNKLFNR
ncbi:MAG: GTPase [candidate division Zixibacteria bacterium]|nr:GTPase [candidate division Zixibacteria bacterium]